MPRDNFNLAAAINGMVSDLNTGAPDVKMIPIVDIIPNPANFYKVDMETLKPLMDSIAMDGLHHYPLVMKHPEEDGKWLLIDGERRYTACKALVEEGNEDFKEIPCTVKEYASTALAELQLILSNSTNRVLSDAELSRQAEKTEMLFYQLKEEGYDFPGRMRDRVAAACNVSATKLAKLKVIREKLTEEYKVMWEQNKLSEQAAYALARMPEEFQERIIKIAGANVPSGDAAEKVLKELGMGTTWDAEKLTCPNGRTCGGGDRFLRHDLDVPYNMCRGEKCCLTCERATRDWSPCERMCSKAKAARQEKKAADEAKAEKKKIKRAKPHQNKTAENARRLMMAIEAARVSDNTAFSWEYYGGAVTVKKIRDWADGIFDGADNWYEAKLEPKNLNKPMEVCKALRCSADFLLGLTDELNGGRGVELKWRSPDDKPKILQEVVAKFTVPGLAKPKMMIANWNGVRWCFPSGAAIDAECVGWWPVPEDEREDGERNG